MISRRQRSITGPIEEFVEGYISTYIRSIRADDCVYLDEPYALVTERLQTLRDLMTIDVPVFTERSLVRSRDFTALFDQLQLMSELVYSTVPDLYTTMNTVANSILNNTEQVVQSMSSIETLLNTVEGSLKKKASVSSVKNEVIVYDTIRDGSHFSKGTLAVDQRSGYICLKSTTADAIPFSVSAVTVNHPKGEIIPAGTGSTTWANISNGYFHGRTFSSSPSFIQDPSTDALCDGSIETGYPVEYNTTIQGESLTVRFDLSFPQTQLSLITLTAGSGSQTSIASGSQQVPLVKRIVVTGTNGTVDVTDRAVNNIVDIGTVQLGSFERTIPHVGPDLYPTGTYLVNEDGVTSVSIELQSNEPCVAVYPEKLVTNGVSTLYRFNYFETLVLDGFVPSDSSTDPQSFYTDSELSEMRETMDVGSNAYNANRYVYRHAVDTREIGLSRLVFEESGTATSSNLNESGKTIAAADLYVADYLPSNTDITYAFSTNLVTWYDVLPSNKYGEGDIPRRLVFSGFDAIAGDLSIDESPCELFLRVTMNGTTTCTPVILAYAVRIKLL